MLTVHHLRTSQSERIVWLCEELGLQYELKSYDRDPVTRLAPPAYKALHPMGVAPVITDGALKLAESGAIVEYLLARHGNGRLTLAASHPDFAEYLFWLHWSNGSLQPSLLRNMSLRRLELPADNAVLIAALARLDQALHEVDLRLGAATFFAGSEFTAADIMTVFSLTTMRHFFPFDLGPFQHIKAYLQRIGAREAYRRAMQKAEPGTVPMLS